MKTTEPLLVQPDFHVAESTVIINPNDGYELGLMSFDIPVSIYFNATIEEFSVDNGSNGQILQENKCITGTITLSMKTWKKINKPKSVRLSFKDNKALISNVLS